MAATLYSNPFHLLGATTRDDRRRLVELAEEKVFELDPQLCRKARSDLTNPRTRVAAEVGWLPGIAPARASGLVERLPTEPRSLVFHGGIPPLCEANLLSAAFELLRDMTPDRLVDWVIRFGQVVATISIDDVIRDINEDRSVAGFPEVTDREVVEAALADQRRLYRTAVKTALDHLAASRLVGVMTEIVDRATNRGKHHAPKLIDGVADLYRVEAQDFLQTEAENVNRLVTAARRAAPSGEGAVDPIVDQLAKVTKNWDRVAQPIQVSFMARGQDHRASNEIAFTIRSLAVDLVNDHRMLGPARRLTDLLHEVFEEVPEILDVVAKDTADLDDIVRTQKLAENQREEWEQEISYSAEIGTIFKNSLSISPDGVSWKGRRYPLEAITRVRWGGVRHSVNFIPTGTTYTIGFGDEHSESVVELRRKDVFATFVQKLNRAVGPRLMVELLTKLKAGEARFGGAVVRDAEILLPKHRFLRGKEMVGRNWHQVQIWSADGSFMIGAKDDKKVVVSLSYIHTPNTHILEQVIRAAFRQGTRRLSDILG